jgi:hypothetical protein
MAINAQSQERAVRRRAACIGYLVRKSRRYEPALGSHGEYMLLDAGTRIPAIGHYYDASIKEIEAFLRD